MITVKFSNVGDFIEELEKDPPPDRIMRVSGLYGYTKIPNLRKYTSVATYLNRLNRIVVLEHYCGEVLTDDPEYELTVKTLQLGKTDQLALEAAGKKIGLDIRNGVLEDN